MITDKKYSTYRDVAQEYSERWYHAMMLYNSHYEGLSKTVLFGSNPLLTLTSIEKYIQEDWSLKALSYNPNITFEFIKKYIYKKWYWSAITTHKNITYTHIIKNLSLPWVFQDICENPNITIDEIEQLHTLYPILDNINYVSLSQSPKITVDFVSRHINRQWWWQYLSCNPAISLQDIIDYPELPWSWTTVAQHPELTWEFVTLHKDKYWSWYYLTTHPNISLDVIDTNIEEPWLWRAMCKRDDLTIEFIEKHIHRDWDWKEMSLHPVITKQFYIEHLHLDWDAQVMGLYMEIVPDSSPDADIFWGWCSHIPCKSTYHSSGVTRYDNTGYTEKVWKTLSMSRKITMEIIDRYIDFDWNWEELSKRNDITLNFVIKHKDKPWAYRYLSSNPYLTLEYVLNHIDKDWNWRWISRNPLIHDKTNWIAESLFQRIAARRIHRFWRDVCWNPEYSYAQKRLMQLFSESDIKYIK